jgi:hypothetical protein
MTYRAGVVTLLAIAMLIATQPLGVFWHFVHDHLGEHSHAAHDGVAIHLGDADAADHDADHQHVWMIPAATAETPHVSQLHVVAVLGAFEDIPLPSRAPFPPFSPPRA